MNRLIRNLVASVFLVYFMLAVLPFFGIYQVSEWLNEKRRKKK